MARDERRRPSDRAVSGRTVYEPRVAVRRIRGARIALGTILVVGVLGYVVFEGWSFTDALYMTVITLTTVGYREVRTSAPPDSCGPWSS
jgi:ion channel